MTSKNLTVVSLFSGAGGLDLGFKQAGFDILWANDFEKDAVETYKNNIGHEIVFGDIRNIPSSAIPDNPDVVLGGFPCQGFSVANIRRNMEDKRNFLYKELLRVVKDKQPKVFIGENVKGLLSMQGGKVIDMIKNDFENVGYKVSVTLVTASDYGVPQNRERVIIFGNRIGLDTKLDIKKTKNAKNVCDVIGFLANTWITNNQIIVDGRVINNHIAATNVHDKFYGRKNPPKQEDICDYLKYWRKKSGLSTKKIDEIFGYAHTAGHWFRKDNNSGSIPKPDDWWKLKQILKFDDKYDKQVTEMELKNIKFEQSLRITNWDTPSDTITATSPEIHVNKKRRLSVRECAILQTFPDDFVFTGSLNSMYRQIGNAVPPLLGKTIAEFVKKSITKYNNEFNDINKKQRKEKMTWQKT
jgi:DNA (cytosine-5)-methyltransferase 1